MYILSRWDLLLLTTVLLCKVPIKSKAAKPAPKRAGKRAAQSTCASSSNPQPIPEMPTEHVQEFKLVWTCTKKFQTVPVERAWK